MTVNYRTNDAKNTSNLDHLARNPHVELGDTIAEVTRVSWYVNATIARQAMSVHLARGGKAPKNDDGAIRIVRDTLESLALESLAQYAKASGKYTAEATKIVETTLGGLKSGKQKPSKADRKADRKSKAPANDVGPIEEPQEAPPVEQTEVETVS